MSSSLYAEPIEFIRAEASETIVKANMYQVDSTVNGLETLK